MSPPLVSTVQPGTVPCSIACCRAAGGREGGGVNVWMPGGTGQLEDQHMLGKPALVLRHYAGDAKREAVLAQQRLSAAPRAIGPDLTDVEIVTIHFSRRRATARPAVRRPRPCQGVGAADESPSSPSVCSAAAPHSSHDALR
ncbi:unnamed protein product [Rhizophagus irregularis]|uniref:Uncharacterized protein n=1 Tax=Rhizophagus irregularis TaxID=588596 RepID=A0A915ZXS3_9GLOM|nr:unnamed protein product [Rhizophagus irregularis]